MPLNGYNYYASSYVISNAQRDLQILMENPEKKNKFRKQNPNDEQDAEARTQNFLNI